MNDNANGSLHDNASIVYENGTPIAPHATRSMQVRKWKEGVVPGKIERRRSRRKEGRWRWR